MSKNRALYLLIVIALLAATAVSLRQVMITKAAGEGSRSASLLQADHSYDGIESMRGSRSASTGGIKVEVLMAGSASADRLADRPKDGKCLDDECSFRLSNGQWVR